MIPILYDKSTLNFDNNGIGRLIDCISCKVTEELNGIYELELTYPITAKYSSNIDIGSYVKVKANEINDEQIFRIYRSTKQINKSVTYYAEHIRYILSYNTVGRITLNNVSADSALNTILKNAVFQHNFSYWTDIETKSDFYVNTPSTIGQCLADTNGCILNCFGGEYEFDNFTIKLHKMRGRDNSITVEYAKNLKGFTCDTNITDCYTHIYPYYHSESDDIVNHIELSEKIIRLNNYNFVTSPKCLPVDLTSYFDDIIPNQSQLLSKAMQYISDNKLNDISCSYNISFVPLPTQNNSILSSCGLGDTVTVNHKLYNIKDKVRVVKTVYNTLSERYESMTLGKLESSFTATLSNSINSTAKNEVSKQKSNLQVAIDNATKLITGNKGGYVILHNNNNGKPEEILIMDTQDINTAEKIWRWNRSGLGYSSTGYNGPYETAITADGQIVANFITAGTLQGIEIIAELGKIGGWSISEGGLIYGDKAYIKPEGIKLFDLLTVNTKGADYRGNVSYDVPAEENEQEYRKAGIKYDAEIKGTLIECGKTGYMKFRDALNISSDYAHQGVSAYQGLINIDADKINIDTTNGTGINIKGTINFENGANFKENLVIRDKMLQFNDNGTVTWTDVSPINEV